MQSSYTEQKALARLKDVADGAFIGFASFEDRCLRSYDILKKCNFPQKSILCFEEFLCNTQENRTKLLADGGDEVILQSGNPIFSLDVLLGMFTHYSRLNIKNIIIDITCFNREILLMFLQVINKNINLFDNINFIYNSAKDMNKDFLSSGILDVHSVLGYGGIISPLKRDHLIVILGFETERARKIMDIYETDRITIAIGKESRSINKKLHGKNKETLAQIQEDIAMGRLPNAPIEVVEIAIDDAIEAQQDLCKIVEQYPEHNNIIAPLNTKLSTVGAGFCAMKNPRVQICYSQMASYNFLDYSTPSNKFYIFDVKEHLQAL